MDKKKLKEAITKLKEGKIKRNFKQRFDLILTLRGLDLKKTDEQVDFYAKLNYPTGKPKKICALIGPELKEEAAVCDQVIMSDQFDALAQDKKALKKLARSCDYFIAQSNIMPKVATAFGKVLGPRGKMPNPKAGCVVPPKANLKLLYDQLQRTVRITAKTSLMVQVPVGIEDQIEEEVVENILSLYDQIIHHLPQEQQNVKAVLLKLTMSPVVRVV
ncbi:hypothetical protein HYW21_06910 [Candidatus Woesearchaeota archaeon]|nr:hypothetical protein [Candidatus Woesearchaeota archaeon]